MVNIKHIDPAFQTSGTNLIYFGDFHHRTTVPGTRIDNFHKTEREKVRQLRHLAKTFNAKAFLQPGDFLDSPGITEQHMNEIMDWWGFNDFKEARQQYDAGEIDKLTYAEKLLDYTPIIGVVGNHELYGASLKSLDRTSIHSMDQRGFVHLVDKTHPYFIQGANDITIAITGNPFDLPINQYAGEADLSYYEQDTKYGDVDIFLTHGFLGGEEITSPYTVLAKRLNTQADVTISGHIHDGFPWIKRGDQYFGNPGSMGQQSASEAELNRVIQATLIHIDEDGHVHIVDIPLDLPEPKEIFDLKKRQEIMKQEERMEAVKRVVESASKTGETNAGAIIKAVAEDEGVPEDVRDVALERTYQMMSEMGANNPLDPNVDYRVKSITLHNFESHQHTVVDLDPSASPTLVIGESSQGKSSILRALYWVLENRGDVRSFVRRRDKVRDAYVEIERMDGVKVRRFVQVSKSRSTGELTPKKNGYLITDVNGEESEYNTTGVTEAQRVFGLNYLQLDDKDSVPINFQRQEDGWYFIGFSDAMRAKIIGALYGTQYITSAIQDFNREGRRTNQEVRLMKDEVQSIDQSLEDLVGIEETKKSFDVLSEEIDALSNKDKRYHWMAQEYNQWVASKRRYQSNTGFVKQYEEPLKEYRRIYDQLEKDARILQDVEREYRLAQRAERVLRETAIYNQVPIQALLSQSQDVEARHATYQIMVDAYNTRCQTTRDLKQYDRLTQVEEPIGALQSALLQIERDEVTFNQLREVFNRRRQERLKRRELLESIEELEKEVKALTEALERERQGRFSYIDYGGVRIYQAGGEDSMELQAIKKQIDQLNNDIIVAKTQAKAAEEQMKESNEKLKELGIDPENAREEIMAFKESLDEEYNKLTQSLEEIQGDLKKA